MSDDAVAWVFPGQGSQQRGMGLELYQSYPSARNIFDQADVILGRPISRICFEGSDEELRRTVNVQPAIYVTSMACLTVARETGAAGADPAYVAGHSLGEYTALAAAGAMDFEAGLRLVEERGRLTQAAADATPGGLAALLGLDEASAEAVCAESGAELCNTNAPGQIVIGGTLAALERARAAALERGARRALKLDVDGAFHTSLMEPAAAPFRRAVEQASIRSPRAPFVANKTGAAMTEASEIAEELVFQLTHPVRWVKCVEFMAGNGVRSIIEIGPGRVLTGLIRRIAPDVETQNIGGAAVKA